MMDKMRMETADITVLNIEKIGAMFPNCITEMLDEEKSTAENNVYKKAVNFELLKQMLSKDVIEGNEAYEFTWVGKKASIIEANKPIRKTLRPCKEESVNWDKTENLYIEGDNLEVLKLLQESYLGKVKMIYIDPPYNTGNDFIYNDDFKMSSDEYADKSGEIDEEGNRMFKNTDSNGRFHSDWCSMIYPRLMLARNLLSDDGVIFISIDDNEQENLKKICDEVFGGYNLVNTFIWNCSTAGGIRPKFASKTHEYIFCYAKNKNSLEMFYAPLSEDAKKMYTQFDERGCYRNKEFVFKNKSTNPNQKYIITCPDGEMVRPKDGYIYRFIRESFEKALKENMVTFKKIETGPLVTTDNQQAHWNIYIKKYLGDAMGAPSTLIPKEMMSLYNVGTQCVQSLFDNQRVFENVKPIDVITYLIKMVANKDSFVLDFFSGSATTAHAVIAQNLEDGGNRKFIMVQLPEATEEDSEAYKSGYKNICEIGKERIRRAGKKILEENKDKEGIENLDIGFRVLKLDDTNMRDVYYSPSEYSQDLLSTLESNVKPDRSDLDLLFGCLLEWGLPLSFPYSCEKIGECTVHNYNDGDLIACFNENISENVIKEIAEKHPLRAVFRDSSFANSPSKINVAEIFKLLAPDTRVKVI